MKRRRVNPDGFTDAWHRGNYAALRDRCVTACAWLAKNRRKPREGAPQIPPVLELPVEPAPGRILTSAEMDRYVDRFVKPRPVFRVV